MLQTNHFTDRESGIAVRVDSVSEHFASITVLRQLVSTYMMPVADYDTTFVKRYLPLDIGSMRLPPQFRMPGNASYWDEEKGIAAPPEPEPEKVHIGEPTTADDMTIERAYAMVHNVGARQPVDSLDDEE